VKHSQLVTVSYAELQEGTIDWDEAVWTQIHRNECSFPSMTASGIHDGARDRRKRSL